MLGHGYSNDHLAMVAAEAREFEGILKRFGGVALCLGREPQFSREATWKDEPLVAGGQRPGAEAGGAKRWSERMDVNAVSISIGILRGARPGAADW